jgi:chromosome partitioning protein
MEVVTILNLKGGVGKSVTACNLAWNMAEDGKNVLVVDLDKQGNTSKFFGVCDYERPTIADVLTREKQIFDVLVRVKERTEKTGEIALAPADMRLLNANRQVMFDMAHQQQNRLATELKYVSGQYDICIVDCPPDIDMGVINALVAADAVIIPVDNDAWALDGLHEVIDQVQVVNEEYNPRLEMVGVLRTKVQKSASSRRVGEMLEGLPVFDSKIRDSKIVPNANNAHKALREFAPNAAVTKDYMALTAEIWEGLDSRRFIRRCEDEWERRREG